MEISSTPSSASNLANLANQPLSTKVFKTINYVYHDFFEETGDPRLKHYPLMNGPWSTLALIALYLYVVKILGPNLMRDRKPYNPKGIMIIYNFLMVAASGWMFFEGCLLTNFGLDLWCCQYVDTSLNYKPMRMIWVGYLFFLSKFVEFLDTIFFVIRKKDSQVSFLHVIHHSIVPISVWIGLKFAPGGNNALFPLLNAFVHTVMYLYYGLAAIGPHMQKYLWWKRYLTRIQMVQFSIVIVHGLRTLFMRDCHFPISFLILTQFNAILFLALFYSFYRQSYTKKSEPKQTSRTTINNNSFDAKNLNGVYSEQIEGQIRECKKVN